MDSWVWWILTCVGSLYFVVLLLEFNKPQQKLIEQTENQETRHTEMRGRLAQMQRETEELTQRLNELERDWDELEERRKQLLPDANARKFKTVPSGTFLMGGAEEESPNNERPAHTVYLSSFHISPFPITNQDYREFVQVTGYRTPIHWQRGTFPTGTGNHPVTNVSWQDAMAYAEWVGARLPSEAEWEKAGRGTDERPYPWGDRFVEGERCNANNMVGTTTPVDEFPDGRSPYGVWDMAGNVCEWCSDYYDEEYYRNSPQANPKGPAGGQERTVRGGTFSDTRAALRTTHRTGQAETQARDNVGFRVAVDGEDRGSRPREEGDV